MLVFSISLSLSFSSVASEVLLASLRCPHLFGDPDGVFGERGRHSRRPLDRDRDLERERERERDRLAGVRPL